MHACIISKEENPELEKVLKVSAALFSYFLSSYLDISPWDCWCVILLMGIIYHRLYRLRLRSLYSLCTDLPCHAKIGPPPKIGPVGLILAGKSAKTGPPDHFCCQTWSGRTDFGCQKWSPLAKISPPWRTDFGKKLSAKIGPPSKWHSYSCAHMATWMQLLYLAMHGYLASLYPII